MCFEFICFLVQWEDLDEHLTGYLDEIDEDGNQFLVIVCEGQQIARIPAGKRGTTNWKWIKVGTDETFTKKKVLVHYAAIKFVNFTFYCRTLY